MTEDFREYVETRSSALLRTAWMLTGDAASAEDLLQTALARTWPHWGRVARGNPDAYVRKVMVRTNISWRARHWSRERPVRDPIDDDRGQDVTLDATSQTDDALALAAVLCRLPPRQRHVVVLRFFEDLSVGEVARVMGIAEGTVKSQCAKALASLRAALTDQEQLRNERQR